MFLLRSIFVYFILIILVYALPGEEPLDDMEKGLSSNSRVIYISGDIIGGIKVNPRSPNGDKLSEHIKQYNNDSTTDLKLVQQDSSKSSESSNDGDYGNLHPLFYSPAVEWAAQFGSRLHHILNLKSLKIDKYLAQLTQVLTVCIPFVELSKQKIYRASSMQLMTAAYSICVITMMLKKLAETRDNQVLLYHKLAQKHTEHKSSFYGNCAVFQNLAWNYLGPISILTQTISTSFTNWAQTQELDQDIRLCNNIAFIMSSVSICSYLALYYLKWSTPEIEKMAVLTITADDGSQQMLTMDKNGHNSFSIKVSSLREVIKNDSTRTFSQASSVSQVISDSQKNNDEEKNDIVGDVEMGVTQSYKSTNDSIKANPLNELGIWYQ